MYFISLRYLSTDQVRSQRLMWFKSVLLNWHLLCIFNCYGISGDLKIMIKQCWDIDLFKCKPLGTYISRSCLMLSFTSQEWNSGSLVTKFVRFSVVYIQVMACVLQILYLSNIWDSNMELWYSLLHNYEFEWLDS